MHYIKYFSWLFWEKQHYCISSLVNEDPKAHGIKLISYARHDCCLKPKSLFTSPQYSFVIEFLRYTNILMVWLFKYNFFVFTLKFWFKCFLFGCFLLTWTAPSCQFTDGPFLQRSSIEMRIICWRNWAKWVFYVFVKQNGYCIPRVGRESLRFGLNCPVRLCF